MKMPAAQFRPGLPGYTGPRETPWRKFYEGNRCTGATRRVGDRQADVQQLAAARWGVTITPVTPRHGHYWEPSGSPLELGVFGGRKAAMAAADEHLMSTRG